MHKINSSGSPVVQHQLNLLTVNIATKCSRCEAFPVRYEMTPVPDTVETVKHLKPQLPLDLPKRFYASIMTSRCFLLTTLLRFCTIYIVDALLWMQLCGLALVESLVLCVPCGLYTVL